MSGTLAETRYAKWAGVGVGAATGAEVGSVAIRELHYRNREIQVRSKSERQSDSRKTGSLVSDENRQSLVGKRKLNSYSQHAKMCKNGK